MALLVLRRVGLCVGQNQMCHLCGWLKLFLKNVRWEKIKIQKRWLWGRLSDGSFVPLLYVYFCRSFLLCRLLGLQVTFRGYTQCGIITTKLQYEAQMFNLAQNFHTKHCTPHCRVAHVSGCFVILPRLCRWVFAQSYFHSSITQ